VNHDLRTRRIIGAAKRVFLEHGFDGASMDEVALEAGVSKRTVYNRYISKEELFDEVAKDACEQLLTFSFDTPSDIPVRDFLKSLALKILWSRLSPDSLALLRNVAFRAHRMESLRTGYAETAIQPVLSFLTTYFESGEGKGVAINADPEDVAWTFFSMAIHPLESKLLMGEQLTTDLETAIVKQADAAVSKFSALYNLT
tara:strand:- start:6935 stop:7534 length:600 start_codon:yes stop_codon:yes gene_type:complete